jgi:hypothetical protein
MMITKDAPLKVWLMKTKESRPIGGDKTAIIRALWLFWSSFRDLLMAPVPAVRG